MMNAPYMGKCSQCDFPATSVSFYGATSTLYCATHTPFKIAPDPRIAALEAQLEEANSLAHSRAMTIERLRGLLQDLAVTMKHAYTFITSREKMHPDGVALYEQDIERIKAELEGK